MDESKIVYTVSDSFKKYSLYSTQVDQYYAAIRIFARHYDLLKCAYNKLQERNELETGEISNLSEYIITTSYALNSMGATNIFNDAPFMELKNLPQDIINFGFNTCFCFQWNLFENFVKQSILDLADEFLLPEEVAVQLTKCKYQTKAFLSYIDSGAIFGHTPFCTSLPIYDDNSELIQCDIKDLNEIREFRNKIIHEAMDTSHQVMKNEFEIEKYYERCMWIVRLFAGNLDQDVYALRSAINKKQP